MPPASPVDRLSQKLPWKENSQVFLWNSGSEAIEAAIKVARCSTGKANIIRMNGAVRPTRPSDPTLCLAGTCADFALIPPGLRSTTAARTVPLP